jgi:sortase (surface protein transpeptidase)
MLGGIFLHGEHMKSKNVRKHVLSAVTLFVAVALASFATLTVYRIFSDQVDSITDSFISKAANAQGSSFSYEQSDIFKEIESPEKVNEEMLNSALYGQARGYYGKLIARSVNLSISLYAGADYLERGAVIDSGILPNQPGLTRIAGHNAFIGYKMDKLNVGDTFTLQGPAGDFTYSITEKGIANEDDPNVFGVKSGVSSLKRNEAMIYTCWPLDGTDVPDRLYLKGELVE